MNDCVAVFALPGPAGECVRRTPSRASLAQASMTNTSAGRVNLAGEQATS